MDLFLKLKLYQMDLRPVYIKYDGSQAFTVACDVIGIKCVICVDYSDNFTAYIGASDIYSVDDGSHRYRVGADDCDMQGYTGLNEESLKH